jgi:hypothetical protein
LVLVLAASTLLVRLDPPATAARAASYSLWDDAVRPRSGAARESRAVQVGLRFRVEEDGWISAIRFYRFDANAGPHVGRLWDATGRPVATVPFADDATTGWKTAELASPVQVTRGTYVVSYRAPHGHYAADLDYFSAGETTQQALVAEAGLFSYGDDMPRQSYRSANYYVDVVYWPGVASPPAAGPSSPPPDRTDASAAGGVRLRPVDGGPRYYDRFGSGLPTEDSSFPVGVWFESVREEHDLVVDAALGINTYVELTRDSDLGLLDRRGVSAVLSWEGRSPAMAGSIITDEADMWAGAGWGAWSGRFPGQGDICRPASARCGFTLLRTLTGKLPETRMVYVNYGKGVAFWLSDEDAAQFVNGFGDVVSVDAYWFTDPNICGAGEGGLLFARDRALTTAECRRAANYGAVVDRVRSLSSPPGAKPVWAFVEVGHPFGQDDAPTITGLQIRAAVWSSLIHGARGIVYFNHSFGGGCRSQHVLRDRCGAAVRADVAAVNAQIRELAPVLNAPFVDGLVGSPTSVDVAAKSYRDQVFVLAAATQPGHQVAALSLACGATRAEVVGENRTVAVEHGRLTDGFADANAVHIYRLSGGDGCRLN